MLKDIKKYTNLIRREAEDKTFHFAVSKIKILYVEQKYCGKLEEKAIKIIKVLKKQTKKELEKMQYGAIYRELGSQKEGWVYKNDDWETSRIGEKHKPMNPRT